MEQQAAAQASEEGDIPKRTVLVLLVITIIVVALGTWTVLERMNYASSPGTQSASTYGQVSLTIIPGDDSATLAEPEAAG